MTPRTKRVRDAVESGLVHSVQSSDALERELADYEAPAQSVPAQSVLIIPKKVQRPEEVNEEAEYCDQVQRGRE